MNQGELFAKRVFWWAGIYGLVVLLPQYFLEAQIGRDFPPPLNHPEYFYGFIGLGLAWQVAFLIIARAPVRLRPIMPAAMLEKFAFFAAAMALYSTARIPGIIAFFSLIDAMLGILFLVAFIKTRPSEAW